MCSNGAVTSLERAGPSGYEVVDTVTFDPAPALTLLRDHVPDALVAVEDLGVGFKVSAPFPDGELGGEQTVVSWDELVADPVTRVTLRQPEATPRSSWSMVEHVGLHGVSYAVGWTAWLDINPEGVSKGSALELVRRRLGVEPVDTVAVGDQRNDIEMLRWAARGCGHGQRPGRGQGGSRRGHRRPSTTTGSSRSSVAAMRTAPVTTATTWSSRRRPTRGSSRCSGCGGDEFARTLGRLSWRATRRSSWRSERASCRVAYVCPELFSPAGRAGSQDIGTQDELLGGCGGSGFRSCG